MSNETEPKTLLFLAGGIVEKLQEAQLTHWEKVAVLKVALSSIEESAAAQRIAEVMETMRVKMGKL